MKYHLILTLDYEVFGNGSGCLCECVVEPVDKLLALLGQYQGGVQCFVDTLEFEAMRRHADVPGAPFDGECLARVESQISALMSAPHSVQLHLHPQWMGSSILEGAWLLDYDRWRIGNLSRKDIDKAVSSGIGYLSTLNEKFRDQGALCFRAGGWAIQPSHDVLSGLSDHGVTIDSTVAPGALNKAKGDWFDFRGAPEEPYWYTDGDILKESASGLLEVPIATERLGKRLHAQILGESKRNAGFPNGCIGSYEGPNSRLQSLVGKLSKLANMGVIMLDFSTLPAWAMIEITQRYMARFSHIKGPVPIVAIGHNKNFSQWSESNMREYLDWVSGQAELGFSSYTQWFSAVKTMLKEGIG